MLLTGSNEAITQTLMQRERPKYFLGQFLSADDFTTEQEYFHGKSQRHNRYLHGLGIAWGLAVTINGKPGENGAAVYVEPGFAVDCEGKEIEIQERQEIPVATFPKTAALYVVVQYRELETSPVPVPGNGGGSSQPSRIVETFTLSLASRDPLASHQSPPGQMTCGRPHPIPVARLTKAKSGWVVDPEFVVPRTKCK